MNNKSNFNQRFCFSDYFLMFFLLGMSANPFIGQNAKFIVIGLLIFILIKYQSRILKPPLFDYRAIIIILFFISFQFIHSIIFELNNIVTTIKVLLFYLYAYFVVKSLNKDFISILINTMYFLSVVSLIFYSLSFIRPLESILYEFALKIFSLQKDFNNYSTPTLLVYTFDPEFHFSNSIMLRNAGFTWEAGSFAFFINITLFFHIVQNKISINDIFQDKISIIFMIALISTFSTSGYLILSLILFYISYSTKRFAKFGFIVLIITIVYIAYNKLDFLGNKIENQISVSEITQNRFGSLLLDWQDIKQRPFTGWSRDEKVLFGRYAYTYHSHRPNGISNMIRVNGIVYFLSLILILYKSFSIYLFRRGTKNFKILSLFIVIIILLSSFSQLLLNKMIILAFLFLFIIKFNKLNRNSKYGE